MLIGTIDAIEFMNAIQNIDCSLKKISDNLDKVANQQANTNEQAITDEQIKEVIKSYPAEDLYKLLNYDQKRYIKEKERMESIASDARDKLLDDFSERVKDCSDDDLDCIAEKVAYLWVECCKYDANLDYWENMNNLIEKALERKGY